MPDIFDMSDRSVTMSRRRCKRRQPVALQSAAAVSVGVLGLGAASWAVTTTAFARPASSTVSPLVARSGANCAGIVGAGLVALPGSAERPCGDAVPRSQLAAAIPDARTAATATAAAVCASLPLACYCRQRRRLAGQRRRSTYLKAAAEADKSTLVKPSFPFAFWAENVEAVQRNADNRKFVCNVAEVVELYNKHRALTFEVAQTSKERNEHGKKLKQKLEPDAREQIIEEGKQIKERLLALEASADELFAQMEKLALPIPNMSHPDTPIGAEENAKVVRIQGIPRTSESAGFELKDHLQLGAALDMFDFENGGKVSGQKFLYFRNGAALLELALVQWALHEAVKKGFKPVVTPDLVRAPVVAGCGFMPRDGEATQIYNVEDSDLCLAGTAEIPVAGMYMNEILVAKDKLPEKIAAFSHAFRTEAGSSGSENRGIYRLHQFSKVELFVVTRGDVEASNKQLEEIRELEEHLFTQLGFCFRVLDMPTEELGAPAYRKFDIEAWMPGLNKWGEISSCSNCTDFQARRLNMRYREIATEKGTDYLHTLNGTACAVPRMIITILETFQNEDGSVTIPEVLRPYMMGMDSLKPE